MKEERITFLDYVRVVACLLVMVKDDSCVNQEFN